MQKSRTQSSRLSYPIQHLRVEYRRPPDLLRGSPCGTQCATPGACSGGWGAGFFPSQQVNSMPSLSYHNHFSVLPTCSLNETVEPSIDMQNPISKNLIVTPTEIVRNRHPKWKRQLPSKLVIALAEDGSTSLKLKIELETTDTGEVKSVSSFMDGGATREFIDHHYAKSNRLHTQKLSKPILVYNVNGTLNEAGSITEGVDLILKYQNHSERTLFTVTGLGKQKLILGHSWLRKHNPEIDWVTGEVKISRCSPWCCSGCRDKARVERIAWKAEIWWTEAVSNGSVPELHTDSEDEEPEEAEEPIEPGDCVMTSTDSGFTTVIGYSQYLIMPKHLSKELAEMNINWKTSNQVSTGLRMDKCQSSNIVVNNVKDKLKSTGNLAMIIY